MTDVAKTVSGASLSDFIAVESARPAFPAATAFAQELARRYGATVDAVLFYGSCLRQNTDQGLMLDYYVLCADLAAALDSPLAAAVGRLLPPNVYYHEMTYEGRTLRAKVAVMATADFAAGMNAFASALWARFAQTTAIVHVRDTPTRAAIVAALCAAVTRMIESTAPLMDVSFTAEALWVRALQETYRAELRPEGPAKAVELVDSDRARAYAVTAAALGAPGPDDAYQNTASPQVRAGTARAWMARRWWGKSLNLARLVKAAFTFSGGLDYAVWKIERHSGVRIALTDADRRRPLLTGLKLFYRVLISGGIK
ncbi:MAG: hypothetical protein SFV21_16580 [Rhodospirillaceae bacterium]|nr:hypothetical protein [Rhodospirillaceae bacterium]